MTSLQAKREVTADSLAWSWSPSVSFQPSDCISMTLANLSAHPPGLLSKTKTEAGAPARKLRDYPMQRDFNQYDPGVGTSPGAEQSRRRRVVVPDWLSRFLAAVAAVLHHPPLHLFAPLAMAGGTYA